jgi:hypothetical protein
MLGDLTVQGTQPVFSFSVAADLSIFLTSNHPSCSLSTLSAKCSAGPARLPARIVVYRVLEWTTWHGRSVFFSFPVLLRYKSLALPLERVSFDFCWTLPFYYYIFFNHIFSWSLAGSPKFYNWEIDDNLVGKYSTIRKAAVADGGSPAVSHHEGL